MSKLTYCLLFILLISIASAGSASKLDAKSYKQTTKSLTSILKSENEQLNVCMKQNSFVMVEAFIKMSPKAKQATLNKIITLQSKLLQEHVINNKFSISETLLFIDANLASDKDTGKMWKALSESIAECHQGAVSVPSEVSTESSEESSEESSQESSEESSEEFKFNLNLNVFKHFDEEEEAQQCYQESLGECRQAVMDKYNSLSEEEQQTVQSKLQEQQQELQSALLEQGEDATMVWVVDYISEHFASDADTGFVWTCIESSLRKCYTLKHMQDGEDGEWWSEDDGEGWEPEEPTSEELKFNLNLNAFKHFDEEEEAEQCYQESLGECRQAVVDQFNSLSEEEQETVRQKFQSQQKELQAAILEQGEGATMTWAVDFIAEHFGSDADTGFIWTCIESSLRKCYTLKHKQDGEDGEWWSEDDGEGWEPEEPTSEEIKHRQQTEESSEGTSEETSSEETSSEEFFHKHDGESSSSEETSSEETSSEELKHKQDGEDGEDGESWSEWSESSEELKHKQQTEESSEGTSEETSSEESSSEELSFQFIEQYRQEFHKIVKKHLDAEEAEECYKQGLAECGEAIKEKLSTYSAQQLKQITKKLQSQLREFGKAMQALGESVTTQDVVNYIESKLSSDPDTGFIWQCIEKSYKACYVRGRLHKKSIRGGH